MKKSWALTGLFVFLLSGSTLAQPLIQIPDNREGWPWGMCVHQVVSDQGPVTQSMAELGAPWVRIDANWYGIELQQGQYDWTMMDKMVDTARANGLIVYATLAYTPDWATQSTAVNGVPTAPGLYANFVSAVVARYKDRVKHWGIWNEPEGSRFWSGTPQQLVDLVLKPGSEAIHAQERRPLCSVLIPEATNGWTPSSRPGAGSTWTSSQSTFTPAATTPTMWRRCY
jgi:hypothetical protein